MHFEAKCFCFLAVVALEEQKANLGRELSTLKHTHSKVRYSCEVRKLCAICITTQDFINTLLCSI